MVQTYRGIIHFDTKSNHPDDPNRSGRIFQDVYRVNTQMMDKQTGLERIRHDLMLIAGGGYTTDTINNVMVKITEVTQ